MLPTRASSEKALRQKIVELKTRVTESHLIANSPEIEDAISIFFKQFDVLMEEAFSKKIGAVAKPGRRTLQEETLEVMIRVKEQQISELLKIFDREQEDTANAYASIKKYLDVASRFLKDSGKQLGFANDTLELAFALASRIKNEAYDSVFDSSSARPIKELSSGERQILIVLTYLAFLAGENSIFVIDEPELSLHVRWQSQLIDALRELRPNGCQIILATHAPEIAGRANENCKILRPSYLNSDVPLTDVIGELNG
jgi:predicted ATPase